MNGDLILLLQLLVAISGVDGTIIWELEKPKQDYYINLYNVLITHDLDSDNHMDVIASHTSDNNSKFKRFAQVKITSYCTLKNKQIIRVGLLFYSAYERYDTLDANLKSDWLY